MFRSGVASFFKAGELTDTAVMEERHALPLERTSAWYGDDLDLEAFAMSDEESHSYSSDDAIDSDGEDLIDEIDEEDLEGEQNAEEGDEQDEGEYSFANFVCFAF